MEFLLRCSAPNANQFVRYGLAVTTFSITTKNLAITLSRGKTALQRGNSVLIAAAILQLDVHSHSDALVQRNKSILTRRRY